MTFFLFPGQGSQTPGMGQDFYDQCPESRAVLDKADAVVGNGFLDTLFTGSDDEVKDTRIAQVGLVAVGIAITRRLETAGIRPSGSAGHSVGEIAALVAAESLDFEDAIRLTAERARLMAEECPEGTMAAVIGLDPEAIRAALPEGAQVGNYNGPQQTIISGTVEAVEQAAGLLKQAGARRVIPLQVSGAFHSRLMKKAADGMRAFVEDFRFNAPTITFVSSVTGQAESDPGIIKELLWKQLDSPVLWTDVMRTIGPADAIETGPGRTLQGLAKRMDGAPSVQAAGTVEGVDALTAGAASE